MKRIFLIAFLIFFATLNIASAETLTTNPFVKVGISNNDFSKYYYAENTFYATDKLVVSEKKSGVAIKEFAPNEQVKIKIKNNLFDVYSKDKLVAQGLSSPLILKTTQDGLIGVAGLKRVSKPALYRGVLELSKKHDAENIFAVMNVLPLETYLKGVVPNEMPVRFGLEALKAQAVAARNYTLRPRERKYHEFDVADSVASQVYFGASSEAPLANQAVEETRGLFALYKDELILALYSSTAGGYTESYQEAFLPHKPENHPYLSAMPDNPSTKKLDDEQRAKEFYKSFPQTYDNDSRYFRWQREWETKELENVLKSGLIANSNCGYLKPILKNPEDFGNLKEIKVQKRGESGKIVSLDIVTDKGIFNVQKELVIRRVFKKEGKAMPSANMVFEQIFDDNKNLIRVEAYGGGFGHGVGMSQFGAGEMARQGRSYGEVLQHYYHGINVATLPMTLTCDTDKNTAITEFYAKDAKAKLVIENKLSYSEVKVVINGTEFKLKAQPSISRKYKVDISPYLKEGYNKIYFFYPIDWNCRKTIKMYVEVKEAKSNE